MSAVKKKTKTQKKVPQTPRRRKDPQYRSFRLHKKIRTENVRLASSIALIKLTLAIMRANWKVFIGLTAVYALTTLIIDRGFVSTVDTLELKAAIQDVFPGTWSGLVSAGVIFSALVGSTTSGSVEGGASYGPLITVINCLAIIWAVRQIGAKMPFRIRDAYYKGMYPLIPFLLVLIVIGLQLIPLSVGTWLYATVTSKLIAVTAIEKFLWLVLFGLFATLSLYMISSSIFALFIVALPNMTPMKALRSARQLVLHRRWIVMRKVVFLPLILLLVCALILLPFLLWVPTVTEWLYFLLSCFGLVFSVTYIYQLYRDLLHE